MQKAVDKRLHALDAQRGVAAIIVMMFHFCFLTGVQGFYGGYLAVDFFFVLSGFVIEKAYGEKLRAGMPVGAFARMRLVRLYPVYFVGLMLGVARFVRATVSGSDAAPPPAVLGATIGANALLLPYPFSPNGTFPINTPSWSLSLEFAVNILFAAFLVRARGLLTIAIIVASAAVLSIGALRYGHIDLGSAWDLYHFGVARTLFSFCLGTLICRYSSGLTLRFDPWMSCVQIALLIVVLMVDVGPAVRPIFDIVAVILFFPLLLVVSARTSASGALAKVYGVLGDLSYPLYAIHYPLGAFLLTFAAKRGLSTGAAIGLTAVICIVAAIALAWVDEKFRAWLAGWLRTRRSAPAQQV